MLLLEVCASCIDNMLKLLLDRERELGLLFIRSTLIFVDKLQWHHFMENSCIVD